MFTDRLNGTQKSCCSLLRFPKGQLNSSLLKRAAVGFGISSRLLIFTTQTVSALCLFVLIIMIEASIPPNSSTNLAIKVVLIFHDSKALW